MSIYIDKMKTVTASQLADILNLFRDIPGRTCSCANFMEFILNNWENIGFFAALKEDESICGFLLASGPSLLEPKIGYIYYAATNKDCPRSVSRDAVKKAEQWLLSLGANRWRCTTVRKSNAFNKAYGLCRSEEQLLEKEIRHVS